MPGTMCKSPTKFWNVAKTTGNDAELTLYGDIYSEAPRDWWTGEKIDGQYITPEGFLEDLETIKNSENITVKLNSCGGDLYTGLAIHNALKSLSGKKTVIVEGIAASAASIIMCAGDTVQVYPGSLIMIHGVSAMFWGNLNIDDLKKQVKAFETSEAAIAEIYSVKTGMKTETLRKMMSEETWMTGQQAVDKGFADELIGGTEPEVNMLNGGKILMINGIRHDISGCHIPKQLLNSMFIQNKKGGRESMNEFQKFLMALQNSISGFMSKAEDDEEGDKKNPNNSGDDNNDDEEEKKNKKQNDANDDESNEDKEKEKEKQENSVQKRIKAAVMAERNRLKEIDELPAGIPADMVNAAKYGDKPCDAKELALQAWKKQAENNAMQLKNLNTDTQNSNANEVSGANAPAPANESDKKIAEAKAFAAQRKERKQGK